MSRTRTAYAVGASSVALAGVIAAGAISVAEPAQAENPTPAAMHKADDAKQDTKKDVTIAPADKPAEKPAVEPVAEAPKPIATPAPAPRPVYPDNLDGWIRQSLDILKANHIPASYEGIHRNIMRESTGNPQAINLYDSNAAAGIPSKGLLQVIDPTFAAYHVEGTKFDVWDPVSNIVAACNYAAHRYGSMDNVNSAY
ncbi:transglycosylase SLT domain-containing protein [Gordonia sp. CPCC 206044]|uniref:transglycosylase SLT domain-containing protein n=1 Tax=Gordonia sp. CPCC 206044 TaxID=3140793 RepID=UPI003AF3FC47